MPKIIFLLVVTFLISACADQYIKVGDYYCEDLLKDDFFQLSIATQEDVFEKFSLDKQYAIYICGLKYIHPPMSGLAKPFAKSGKNAIPFLKEKLERQSDPSIVAHIIYIFQLMNVDGHYDVKSDKDLVNFINDKINVLPESDWKTEAKVKMVKIDLGI